MLTKNVQDLFTLWKKEVCEDKDLYNDLIENEGNEEEINDRFYRELSFGTAGLRGIIGAGTNRMNIYTVSRATQGLADYLNAHYKTSSVAISYDSRINSDVFSKAAASVLAANGIMVHIMPELMPTPMLSFAVRYLKCQAGIMVTASHNPSKYNGYKCYGSDGGQMTEKAADEVTSFIQKHAMFHDVKTMDYEMAVSNGQIQTISQDLLDAFMQNVLKQQIHTDVAKKAGLKVVYTPLNGTGNKPVKKILSTIGMENVLVVPEQENPDGHFP
ncbi:MAG: phospho-sugar mutase, partial [Clostridia bacterium]|nr:phospho-sugar mutase [Clostridia bacterium]